MLLKLREFIQREQLVSTQQLARAFHIDEQALQAMLDIWVKKGVIQSVDNLACKSACTRSCRKIKTTLSYYSIATRGVI